METGFEWWGLVVRVDSEYHRRAVYFYDGIMKTYFWKRCRNEEGLRIATAERVVTAGTVTAAANRG